MWSPSYVPRCPVCGARLGACGGPTTHEPVDTQVTEVSPMGEAKRYELDRGNGQSPAVVVLTEEQAEQLGAKAVDEKSKTPTTKSRTAQNK